MSEKSIADVEGPWTSSIGETTGLIERCRLHWSIPANQLPDLMVATYLSQCIATSLMIDEARRRLASGIADGSELYDGQLAEALSRATAR